MTRYTQSRIDRILRRAHRHRKRSLDDADYHPESRYVREEEDWTMEYECKPDSRGDGRIVRKEVGDV